MSFGNGYNGGRTRMGTKVFLNIYDISPANDFLFPIGMGLHHSGVEVLGSEYSFASNAGIFESSPKEAAGAKFRQQLEVGVMDGGQAELRKALDDLRAQFGPTDYNIVKKNCNHFANALLWRLLGKTAPAYVNRIADVGNCCSCLLPKQMLEHAPVGDPDSTNTNGMSGVYSRGGAAAAPSANKMRAFSGAGHSLGGTDNNQAGGVESEGLLQGLLGGRGRTNSAKGVDDLTDRREKARKAALARLDLNQQQNQTSNESKDK